MKTITMNTLKKTACVIAMGWMTTACVNSPLPAGSEAELFTWSNQPFPETQRTALLDEAEGAFYTGNFVFSDVHKTNPSMLDVSNAPVVLRACDSGLCYYAVVFPNDYKLNDWGLVAGHVSLTGLSSAMYHQVKDLPAHEVEGRLNELADLLLSENVEQRSYADFLALDIRRNEAARDNLRDQDLATKAANLASEGYRPTLMSLINEGIETVENVAKIEKTTDLTASREFVFSDSWDLEVDINISSSTNSPSYLMICGEFKELPSGYEVDYNNCALKTELVGGRLESTLRMTGNTRELLVTVMSLENPNDLKYTRWDRDESGPILRMR